MPLRYPNRTGEIGSINDDVVTLSGQTIPGLRLFSAAATAEKLADGDTVGISIQGAFDPSQWAIWRATYDATAGTLTADTVEDSAGGAFSSNAAVRVAAVLTGDTLVRLDPPVVVPEWNGPDWWSLGAQTSFTWDEENAQYVLEDGGNCTLTPTGTWAAGYRPSSVSLEIYVPSGGSPDIEYTKMIVYHDAGADEIWGDTIGSDHTADAWNTITCDLSVDLDTDISSLAVGSFPSSYQGVGPYRFRNITFTA